MNKILALQKLKAPTIAAAISGHSCTSSSAVCCFHSGEQLDY